MSVRSLAACGVAVLALAACGSSGSSASTSTSRSASSKWSTELETSFRKSCRNDNHSKDECDCALDQTEQVFEDPALLQKATTSQKNEIKDRFKDKCGLS